MCWWFSGFHFSSIMSTASHRHHLNQPLIKSPKVMGLIMASPFLICFLLFGVINITAGTLITLASINTDQDGLSISTHAMYPASANRSEPLSQGKEKVTQDVSSQRILATSVRNSPTYKSKSSQIDARRLVGIVLLSAGTTLITIGLGIGIVACRSVTTSKSYGKCQTSLQGCVVIQAETGTALERRSSLCATEEPPISPAYNQIQAPPVSS